MTYTAQSLNNSLKVEKIEVSKRNTPYYSAFVDDYLNGKLSNLHHFEPSFEGIKNAIDHRLDFSIDKREALFTSLKNQYEGVLCSEKLQKNINLLKLENTFTITTGQQIHIGLGPLYVIYKALDTIRIANELSVEFPEYNFVPIFWMATEDHDLEEVNYVNIFGKKIVWESKQSGAVGRMNTDGISELLETLKSYNLSPDQLRAIDNWKEFYSTSSSLANATRHILNNILGEMGLVILDADCCILKKGFEKIAMSELLGNHIKSFEIAQEAIRAAGYETQLHIRDVNLFFLEQQSRNRIIKEEDSWQDTNGKHLFDAVTLEQFVKRQIVNISPNAALRPIYQETILPNVAYVGGNAEIKYWMQLKGVFEINNLKMPVVLPRTSFLWLENFDDTANIENYWLSDDEFLMTLEQKLHAKVEQYRQTIDSVYEMLEKISDTVKTEAPGIDLSHKTDKLKERLVDYSHTLTSLYVQHSERTNNSKRKLKAKNRYFSSSQIQERHIHVIEQLNNLIYLSKEQSTKTEKTNLFNANLNVLVTN